MTRFTKILYLPTKQLELHPLIQREQSPTAAKQMAKNFDPDALGLLHAVPSPVLLDLYLLIDGGTRWAAAKLVSHSENLCVKIYYGLTNKELAGVSRRINASRAWAAADRHQISIIEEDPKAKQIQLILSKHNWGLSKNKASDKISCPDRIYKAYDKLGAEGLDYLIKIMNSIYNQDSVAFQGKVIEAYTEFIFLYRGLDIFNDDRMLKFKLDDLEWRKIKIYVDAKERRKQRVYNPPEDAVNYIRGVYNNRLLTKNKLPTISEIRAQRNLD